MSTFDADCLWRVYSLHCLIDTPKGKYTPPTLYFNFQTVQNTNLDFPLSFFYFFNPTLYTSFHIDIEHMNGQRFVNMMIACDLPHHEDLTAPALRVIATAAARGHVKKQEYDSGHTATRIFRSALSSETIGRVTTHGRKLSYEDFLNALMRVAKRLNAYAQPHFAVR